MHDQLLKNRYYDHAAPPVGHRSVYYLHIRGRACRILLAVPIPVDKNPQRTTSSTRITSHHSSLCQHMSTVCEVDSVLDHKQRSKETLRLWLRLLPVTSLVEQELRTRLRQSFGITLPQFDIMAELERAGEPQTMSELSRRLLVSGGNVTGVVDRLERDGYVARQPLPTDRRVQLVALTDKGRGEFGAMAAAHEQWLSDLFSDLPTNDIETLHDLLGRAKSVLRQATAPAKDRHGPR